ncbi:hypothetical protein B0H63DRAFT_158784 [Podospora didyma]|uniref:Uncharacterized protein n=1 Tax=Podospora didyma TaxID=330526 RepID=A0AAE0NTT5_9PEZI|nr:hypothetical protein B0H63DRAFT_158784 [Podospora didyma]
MGSCLIPEQCKPRGVRVASRCCSVSAAALIAVVVLAVVHQIPSAADVIAATFIAVVVLYPWFSAVGVKVVAVAVMAGASSPAADVAADEVHVYPNPSAAWALVDDNHDLHYPALAVDKQPACRCSPPTPVELRNHCLPPTGWHVAIR